MPLTPLQGQRVALVHEWLTTYGGSEGVLHRLADLFPGAPVHVLVHDQENYPDHLDNHEIHTSFIQNLPAGIKKYRNYLPLYPFAIEQLNLTEFDWVISSNHAVAKGVLTSTDQFHLCYCHTPIRYAWDLTHEYLNQSGMSGWGPKAMLAKLVLHYLRIWDQAAAARVDAFVANSEYIARRIRKIYRRPAVVIHPPVEVERFNLIQQKEDYYLCASRMVPYKRMDLIIRAFKQNGKRLKVIGEGPMRRELEQQAGDQTEFLGKVDDQVLAMTMAKARALVFVADEDFGIMPLEAQACGTPVIAWAKGGVLETVKHGFSGYLFQNRNVASIVSAIESFENLKLNWDAEEIRNHAMKYSPDRFCQEITELIQMLKYSQSHGQSPDRVIQELSDADYGRVLL